MDPDIFTLFVLFFSIFDRSLIEMSDANKSKTFIEVKYFSLFTKFWHIKCRPKLPKQRYRSSGGRTSPND